MMPDQDAKVRAQLAALFAPTPSPVANTATTPVTASDAAPPPQQPADRGLLQPAAPTPVAPAIAPSPADPLATLARDQAQDPTDVALRVRTATALADAGRNTDALDLLRAADAAARNDPTLLLLKGQLELRLQYGDQASVTYRQILSVNPQSVEALNGLGIANVTLGMPATAEEYFRRAVAAAPKDVRSRNNLGLSLALQGKTNDAIKLLTALLQQDTTNAGVRRNLALAYTIANDRKAAVAVLTPVMSAADADSAVNAFAQQEVYPRYHPAATPAAIPSAAAVSTPPPP